ncbi:hypothetical protein [Melittangium boletus]|uniref:Uncharacterized protein n=1 Tax=Melittangium boletus DSM 14713 TaxID=1294270 RepID=A0A250ITM3_9BACT|nr:hypothetical protein [Melittangium boletus]ATB34590.1 hypothetical protein MEBOL_008095 [Melittangium boletus DSM 14713]
MSRRLYVLLCSTWLAVPVTASAQNLSPEQLARIRLDEKEALKKIDDAHGGKKPSEMSSAERRQVIEEQRAAVQEVKEKHGVSEKDYARQTARMGPKQNAEVAAAEKELEAKQKAAAAAETRPEEIIPVEVRDEFIDPDKPEAPPAESEPGLVDVPVTEEGGVPVEELDTAQVGSNTPTESPSP